MAPVAETPRLRLREFGHGDLEALASMVADEEQMTFYPRARTREEAAAWLARNIGLYCEHGYGFWLVESLATGDFAGYCGIRPLSLEGAAETEIGWHVGKTLWNRGVATEAATATLELAFGRFGLKRLVALIGSDHLASLRVAEKIGMRAERNVVLEGQPFGLQSIETMSTTNTSVSFGPIAGGKPCAP